MISLSIVIPAYNEEESIADVVRQAMKAAEKIGARYEIIILNDGSVDTTASIIEKLMEEFPEKIRTYHNVNNQGIAFTLERLFALANKDYILDIPGDGQINPSVIGILCRPYALNSLTRSRITVKR